MEPTHTGRGMAHFLEQVQAARQAMALERKAFQVRPNTRKLVKLPVSGALFSL